MGSCIPAGESWLEAGSSVLTAIGNGIKNAVVTVSTWLKDKFNIPSAELSIAFERLFSCGLQHFLSPVVKGFFEHVPCSVRSFDRLRFYEELRVMHGMDVA
ncbi:hypothetical protein AGMMS49992_22250 [Clostridia bacterium]|nr:hypothetical protein AGMMS49992_22250 [Clostridia bacterium]